MATNSNSVPGTVTETTGPEDGIVRVVTKVNDEQPSAEHSFVTCHDCLTHGYSLCCHEIPISEKLPDDWETRFVCRDCAERDDPYTVGLVRELPDKLL